MVAGNRQRVGVPCCIFPCSRLSLRSLNSQQGKLQTDKLARQAVMAEFRKFNVQFDSGVNTYDRTRVVDPPGYDPAAAREQGDGSSSSTRASASKLPLYKRQEALQQVAMAPLKQVAMLCFMMYMSGSQLHIFSIMTTMSGLYQPLSAILKSGQVFPPDPEGELNMIVPRVTYCLVHGLGLACALWKINGMGLLPTNLSDWLSSIRPPTVLEHAAGNLLAQHQ